MDHAEAVTSMATEKYLLGELSEPTREEFEEHFFGCKACADDVRSGATFLEHSKVILAQPATEVVTTVRNPQPKRGSWSWGLAWACVAVLLVVVGYQNLIQVPHLQQVAGMAVTPYVMPSASLINVNSRGTSQAAVVNSAGKPFLLFLDIPENIQYASYVADLQDAGGNIIWSLPVSSEMAKDTLPVQVPRSKVSPGEYAVVVSGLDGESKRVEVGRYPFQLKD